MSYPRPLFACQNPGCAEEVSYYKEDLATWNGKPICVDCYGYEFEGIDGNPDWHELPPIVTEADTLRDRLERAVEYLEDPRILSGPNEVLGILRGEE